MWLIFNNELRGLLYNPKFIFVFIAAFLLICTSVFNGYLLFKQELTFYQAELAKTREDFASSGVWSGSTNINIYRRPSELSIFDLGTHGVIGRQSVARAKMPDARVYYSSVTPSSEISNDLYSDNPVLALFGDLNLTFVAATVLSLFAILLSYNSVSGEREDGTLALLLSNSVKRSSIFFGKLFSGLITVLLLFLLPFIAALAGLLLLTEMSFSADQWLRIAFMAGTVCLYLGLFQVIAISTSSLVRSSFFSFMICLLIWVAVVILLPRISMQMASSINPPLTREEVTTQTWVYLRQHYNNQQKEYLDFIEKNVITRENYSDKVMAYNVEQFKKYNQAQQQFFEQLWQEYIRRRRLLAETATSYSRISPYPCLLLTIYASTGTGHDLLSRFETAIDQYQPAFEQYGINLMERFKEELDNRRGGPSYKFQEDSAGYMRVKLLRENEEEPPPLDVGVIPNFELPLPDLPILATETLLNTALIFIYTVVYMLIGYVAFLRYDVRS